MTSGKIDSPETKAYTTKDKELVGERTKTDEKSSVSIGAYKCSFQPDGETNRPTVPTTD